MQAQNHNQDTEHGVNAVLLVDDNELDIFINSTYIKRSALTDTVYSATSARSALEFLANIEQLDNGDARLFPKLLIVDLNMPITSGLQFFEIFLESSAYKKYKPTLVLLTSSTFTEDRLSAKALSKDIMFLNKPLNQEMLREIFGKPVL